MENVSIGQENVLERLVVTGKLTETVNVLGQEITLQVLDAGDQREVFDSTANLDTLARIRGIQQETLARSIIALNGNPVTYVAKNKEEKVGRDKLIQQNIETLRKANQDVVELIFQEYEKLVEKQSNNIEDLKKKYANLGQETGGELEKQSE